MPYGHIKYYLYIFIFLVIVVCVAQKWNQWGHNFFYYPNLRFSK